MTEFKLNGRKKNRERNDIGTLQHIWKNNIGVYVYIIHYVLNIYELVHYNKSTSANTREFISEKNTIIVD